MFDDASRLGQNDGSCSHVPKVERCRPVTVQSTTSYISQVEGSRAESADAAVGVAEDVGKATQFNAVDLDLGGKTANE